MSLDTGVQFVADVLGGGLILGLFLSFFRALT